MRKQAISNNVIRRLPRYLRRLEELSSGGVERISSGELGRQLGITPSQVRQDLSSFGEFGVQGYGYNIIDLRNQIANILGSNYGYHAVMIGAGKIGTALISNFSFEGCGVTLLSAFDVREELIGGSICGVPVYDIADFPEYARSHRIDIAVLAVPKQAAIRTVRMLQSCGIDTIWNLTNTDIKEPGSSMLVENIHFSDSLYALTYYLTEKREQKICG